MPRSGRGGASVSANDCVGSDAEERDDVILIQSLINKSLEGHNASILQYLKINMQLIDEKLDKIVIDVADLKRSKEFAEGYTTDIKSLNDRIKAMQTEVEALKRVGGVSSQAKPIENQNVTFQLAEIKRKLTDLEDRSRRNNLRIDGVEEDDEESWENTKTKLQQVIVRHFGDELGREVKLERVHRTGAKTPGRNRTIVAQFSSWTNKSELLNNSSKLKDTGISLYEDFCKETVEIRKKLVPEMKKARLAGKYATINYNKLVIKDRPTGNNT